MAGIIENRMSGVREQMRTLKRFATSPKGVFSTIDEMLRTFRQNNKEDIESLLGKKPEILRGGF